MNGQSGFYTVKKGDTLWKLAKEHGTTTNELKKINGLKNTDRITVGQRIALRKEAVCGIEALFLDRDRNPIAGLEFRIERCGKIHDGITGENGKSKRVFTDTPHDEVRIWVQRLDGTWKSVTTVVSGFGNKLVTLISGHVMVQSRTEKHPDLPVGTMLDARERSKPRHAPGNAPSPTTNEKELGFKTTSTKTLDGKPLTVVEGDISGLDFLKYYRGGKITEEDWKRAADELKCEVYAIHAVAKVESSGAGFDKATNRPIILFERHVFHAKTNGKFSKRYPDVSSENAYLRVRDKQGKIIQERKQDYDEAAKTGRLAESDFYPAEQTPNYKRLAKAIQLDRAAALKSCSWGMFQVMGFNHLAAGFPDIESFVTAMVTSEREQLNVFLYFIKADKTLLKAVQQKDWLSFAIGYNGKKQEGYDRKMEKAYSSFRNSSSQI